MPVAPRNNNLVLVGSRMFFVKFYTYIGTYTNYTNIFPPFSQTSDYL